MPIILNSVLLSSSPRGPHSLKNMIKSSYFPHLQYIFHAKFWLDSFQNKLFVTSISTWIPHYHQSILNRILKTMFLKDVFFSWTISCIILYIISFSFLTIIYKVFKFWGILRHPYIRRWFYYILKLFWAFIIGSSCSHRR